MIFLKIRLYLYGYVSGCLTQAERLILLQIECTDGIEAICPERKVVAAGLAIVHRHTVGFIQHTALVKFQIKRASTLVGRSLYWQHISAIKHRSDTFFQRGARHGHSRQRAFIHRQVKQCGAAIGCGRAVVQLGLTDCF